MMIIRFYISIFIICLVIGYPERGIAGLKLELVASTEWGVPLSIKSLPEEKVRKLEWEAKSLFQVQRRYQHLDTFYSRNGRLKAVTLKFPHWVDGRYEGHDSVITSLYDSSGSLIWKGQSGDFVMICNDGQHFVSRWSDGQASLYFHSVDDSSGDFSREIKRAGYVTTFSEDGRFLIDIGLTVDLYTSDGKHVWTAYSNSDCQKHGGISYDGSKIVVVSMPEYGDFLIPKFSDHKLDHSDRIDPAHSLCYITTLDGDGKLLSQTSVDYRVVHEFGLSKSGSYAAVSRYHSFIVFETNSGKQLWAFGFEDKLGHITGLAFSDDDNLLAMGATSHGGKADASRVVYLFDIQSGELLDSTTVKDEFSRNRVGPSVLFSSDGEFLIVGGPSKKHVYKIKNQP